MGKFEILYSLVVILPDFCEWFFIVIPGKEVRIAVIKKQLALFEKRIDSVPCFDSAIPLSRSGPALDIWRP